jgi:RimJ/RimL family protein N-acetyltransferase
VNLRNQDLNPKDMMAILTKWMTMSHYQREEFEAQLNETPKVSSIEESDKVIAKVDSVTIYNGVAKGTENYWNGSFISQRDVDFPVEIVKDNQGRFQFTLQRLSDEVVHLMCCSVSLDHQGRGLSKEMVKSIKSICFEHYDYHSIEARAAKPRNDPGIKGEDWRSFHVNFKGRSMTALERFWLSQKDCFPRRDYESDADPDQFLILNIKYN